MRKLLLLLAFSMLLLFLPSVASAATYYVNNQHAQASDTNPGTEALPLRTIQRCANIAVAGDICIVRAGSYNEAVNAASSGAANNLIEFQASGNAVVDSFRISGRHYIRIEGFEITDLSAPGSNGMGIYISGSNGTEIIGNRIHHTMSLGIWLTGGADSNNNIIIRSNNISFPGAVPDLVGDGAINMRGNNILVENNDISHVGDFTNAWGYYNVIRNNYFHDCYMSDFPGNTMVEGHHIDGMQYYSTADTIPFHFLLFENNSFDNIVMSNGHAAILRNVEGRDDSDAIFRYNNMYRAGSSAVGMSPFDGVRIYNNDIINVANDPRIEDIPGIYTYAQRSRNTISGYNSGAGITRNIKIINNLFYNSTRQDSISRPYYVDPAASSGFYADFNLAYLSGSYGFNEPHGILGVDPGLRNYLGADFSLAEGSVAIDAGGPLTNVSQLDSGSGSSLVVSDARYFQDGWAGVEPDWIAVGNANNVVQIQSINYDANVITLAGAISRSAGDPVWLYKDSNGRRVLYGDAPDMGAYEYVSAQPTTCSDGTAYGACSSNLPRHCDNGMLSDMCSVCGCPSGTTCQANGSCSSVNIINAASCSQADVQAAIDAASDGDTVSIPSGSCTWSSTVTIPNTKGLTISGQGAGNTVISGTASPKLRLNAQAGYYSEINSMEFSGGSGTSILVTGAGTNVFRITRLKFYNVSIAVDVSGVLYGVVDHCEFRGPTPYPIVRTGDGNAGVDSWYAPLDLGGPTAVYLEDSVIYIDTPITGVGMSDSNDGGRIVIRHNNITNHWWGMHDACPNFRMGGRKFEVYDNQFFYTSTIWTSCYHRGGTGVVFNNLFRSAGVINAGTPLRFNRVFYRGISSGCQYLWETYCDAVDEMMCSDGSGKVWPLPCTTDADCTRYGGHCDTVVDEPGVGYPCRSQSGTDTGRVNNPIAGWNNYFCQTGISCNPATLAWITVNSDAYPYVREERDFIDDTTCSDGVDNDEDGLTDMFDPTCVTWWTGTQKSGYAPYAYPHPLVSGSAPPNVPGDINGNSVVDINDLVALVIDFGKTSGFTYARSDTDNSGMVDIFDMTYVGSRIT